MNVISAEKEDPIRFAGSELGAQRHICGFFPPQPMARRCAWKAVWCALFFKCVHCCPVKFLLTAIPPL